MNVIKMSRVKSIQFFVCIIFLSACSTSRSFKLVNAEKQQSELVVTKVQASIEMNHENVQASISSEEQMLVDQMTFASKVQVLKRLVVEEKVEAVQ